MEVNSDASNDEDTPFTCPSRNDVHEAMELMCQFNLFSKNVDLDPIFSTLEQKINQHRQQQIHKSSMDQYFDSNRSLHEI